MADMAIEARRLSKRYQIFDNQRQRLIHALLPRRAGNVGEVWALREVDFSVERGESVAVIGRNGGGKSTLLQILTGTLSPTSGEVQVRGRVSALLELGSGFNPDYTGRDNVILNGLLLGLSRVEIHRRFEEIAQFAEVGEAIDRPLRTYSSGMMMRLAFAVQVLTDPEILVIDEALSVGDFFFQQKCFAYLRGLRERGVTLVFVSHDMGTVRDTCTRAIYLRNGRLEYAGDTREAIRRYLAEGTPAAAISRGSHATDVAASGELEEILRDAVWRSAGAIKDGCLLAVAFYDTEGRPSTSFRIGDTLHMKVAYLPASNVPTHVSAAISNKYDQVLTSVGSSRLGLLPPHSGSSGEAAIFEMKLQLTIEAGNYAMIVTLARLVAPNRGENIDSSGTIGPITVRWDYDNEVAPFLGMVGLPAEGTFRRVAAPRAERSGA